MDETTIAWAAGFLEGEGSFLRNKGYAVVHATQKDREMLDKLQRHFGGSICMNNGPSRRASGRCPLWQWRLFGKNAETLMIGVMPYMSTRRRETIREALNPQTSRWR